MKQVILLAIFLLAGNVNADAPYKYSVEQDATKTSGKVVLQSPKGWSYVGSVVNGKPHGNGVKITDKGMLIYGDWVDGELKGEGAIYNPAPFNSLNAGYYENDKIVGDGVIIMEGEAYQGPFGKYGAPHGKGLCTKDGIEKSCSYNHGAKLEE